MLKKVQRKSFQARNARFAIVASKYNAEYVDPMVHAAKTELDQAGAKEVRVLRVPGAYEVPIVAAELASGESNKHPVPDAIICLGVILRGETVHATHIGDAVSRALMQIQLQRRVPVIHEVLLLENRQQAVVRCQGRKHNRGTEAAQTALAMAALFQSLRGSRPTAGPEITV